MCYSAESPALQLHFSSFITPLLLLSSVQALFLQECKVISLTGRCFFSGKFQKYNPCMMWMLSALSCATVKY